MRRDVFSNTRCNIMGISIGIVMGTLLVFAIITQSLYKESLFDEVDHQLLMHKNMILNDAHIQYDGDKVVEVILPSPLVKELINYVWQDNTLVKDSPHLYKGSSQYPVFEDNVMNQLVLIQDGTQYYRGIQFMYEGCKVQLLLNVQAQMDSLSNLQNALLIAFLLLVAIGLFVSFYLAKVALKPLYKAYYKQTNFIQDASHEMRTPLAVMKGNLELMAKSPNDRIAMHYETISSIMSEISGLEKLNKDLLLLSKEDMNDILEIKKIVVPKVFEEVVELYTMMSELHGIKLTYRAGVQEIEVEWDWNKVKRCIAILLDNAIKYSVPEDYVTLEVEIEEKYVKVTVKDTGRGIKSEELEHIFDRFYRSSEVRASDIEGSGIGLSLLQSLAYTMGIKIKVSSEYGKGSCFILWIPRNINMNKFVL